MDLRWLALVLVVLRLEVRANSTRSDAFTQLQQFLVKTKYDKNVRPLSTDESKPIEIGVFVHLVRTKYVCPYKSMWEGEIFLKQRWQDPGLAYSEEMDEMSGGRLLSLIWSPATFFPEASVESKTNEEFARISHDGYVSKITRLVGVFPCQFNSTAQSQRTVCSLKITSFEDDGKDVSYTWGLGPQSVSTKPGVLDIGDYEFQGHILTFSEHGNKRPSVLTAEVVFHRNSKRDCRLFLLPITICVIVSLLALFVPIEKVTCRFIMSVVSMFGGTAIFMYYVSKLTKGGLNTPVEKYLYGCLAAIALTLLDHLLAALRTVYKETKEVTYVEARDNRTYLSQQQYRVLQKHPDHQRLLQCTPEPKESRLNRCMSCLRRAALWLVAVLDWLLRIGVPVAFGLLIYFFCQHWCQSKAGVTRNMEAPVYRLENVVTPMIL